MADNRTELQAITSGALAAALIELLPIYKAKSGADIDLSFGSSFGVAHDSIPSRLANGQRFDMYFMARGAVDELTSQGLIREDSGVDLVESHIGAMVRREEAEPDISTVEDLRKTLLAAESIAYSASASGIYLSTEVFPSLGIAKEMKKTARKIFSERVGTVVARGEADLGFQQISEIVPIKNVKVVGRLPAPYQRSFRFCAAIGTESEKIESAKKLIRFIASEEASLIIQKSGLDPLFPEII